MNKYKISDPLLYEIEKIEEIVDKAEDQVDDIIEEYGNNASIASDKVAIVFLEIKKALDQAKSVVNKKTTISGL